MTDTTDTALKEWREARRAQVRQELEEWLKLGRAKKASHMLVVADLFRYENYPIYVLPGQNVFLVADEYRTDPTIMRKLMGIFSYALPLDEQLEAPDSRYCVVADDLTGDPAPLLEFPLQATYKAAGTLERLLAEPQPDLLHWREAVRQVAHQLREMTALVVGSPPSMME